MWIHLGITECRIPFSGHCDLDLDADLVFRRIVSLAYLLYYLRKESQIQCVDASWTDEVSHTIVGSL